MDTETTEDLDETTLTPGQTEAVHTSIKRALHPDSDISEALTAWASAKRAITKTIERGGFNSPLADITKPEALNAIESASSLAERLRRYADNLERETEGYRFQVEDTD